MTIDRSKTESGPDLNQPLFFQEGIHSPHLAETYEKLFGFVQATRPKAFDGYVSTRSGFWYQAAFGWMRQRTDGQGRKIEAYRGYVQIDPRDLPEVIEILLLMALKRLDHNRRTEFKVLLGTNPPMSKSYGPKERLTGDDLKAIGTYNNLSPNDAELVIYGESQTEITEVLTGLASSPKYEMVERRFRQALRFVQKPFYPRGTNTHSDNNRSFLTISYNDRRGNYED